MTHLIAPSILAADFNNLEKDISMVNKSQADWLHVDVMDGHFVPNISFGQPLVKHMKKISEKPLDVHLMIEKPGKYISDFAECGADVITIHFEACNHLHRSVNKIKSLGVKAGIALNPHTNVGGLEDILEEVDLICLMSVNPGYGGQKFIYQTISKVEKLKEMITTRNLNVKIEIDGGVGLQNAEKLLHAGADVLVAGSSVFKSEDPIKQIERLKSIGGNNTYEV